MPSEPKVIAIVGPTASGKSAVGLELALALDGEIVSADSMEYGHGHRHGEGHTRGTRACSTT